VGGKGRVLNRFTKDLGGIDEFLPTTFFDTINIFLQAVGVLVIVMMANYFIIPPVFLLVLVFGWIRGFFLRTSRQIKRIEAVCESPFFFFFVFLLWTFTFIVQEKIP
jgi:ATP-binding cassette subfamily C (CFTR/MRP) protein 4